LTTVGNEVEKNSQNLNEKWKEGENEQWKSITKNSYKITVTK